MLAQFALLGLAERMLGITEQSKLAGDPIFSGGCERLSAARSER
jgi:hypothetical protein